MYLKTALDIIVAFFCVIGIYAIWRMISQRLFGNKNIIIAVEITSLEDADSADELIREALGLFLSLRSQKIIVITTAELQSNSSLINAVRKYGAELYACES